MDCERDDGCLDSFDVVIPECAVGVVGGLEAEVEFVWVEAVRVRDVVEDVADVCAEALDGGGGGQWEAEDVVGFGGVSGGSA